MLAINSPVKITKIQNFSYFFLIFKHILSDIFDNVLQVLSLDEFESTLLGYDSSLDIIFVEFFLHDLLEDGHGGLGGLLHGHRLVVHLLQALLSSLASTADGFGVKLDVGSAGIHVEQLGASLVTPCEKERNSKRPGHGSNPIIIVAVAKSDGQV